MVVAQRTRVLYGLMIFMACVFMLTIVLGTAYGFPGFASDCVVERSDCQRVIDSLVDAGGTSCQVCHVNSNGGQPWNAYGLTLHLNGVDFAAAEGVDSDGDGSTNLSEIQFDPAGPYGAQPGWTEDAGADPGNVSCFEIQIPGEEPQIICETIDPPSTAGPLDPTVVAVCGNEIIEATEDCDDGNTEDGDCCDAQCQFEPADSECPDGDLCNGDETCDGAGSCQAGTPLNCIDELACNGVESCDSLTGCLPGNPVDCPDGQICEEPEGVCVTPPECEINADCDDGVFCNGVETCNAGTCGAVSACPPFTDGCVVRNADCDEENDTCIDVANDDDCIDDSLCTEDICNAETGQCENPPVDCGDGIDCTDDLCNEDTGECMNDPNDANCQDDGFFCTGQEICDPATGCLSEGDPCPEGTVCNDNSDTCVEITDCGNGIPETGEDCDDGNVLDGDCCSANCTFEAEGSSCEDEEFCNGEETCDGAGLCLAGTEVDCSDGVDCTIDSCDEINDVCVNTPDDNNCPDDQLFCNGQEICDPEDGCVSSGDPCFGEICNEDDDACEQLECVTDTDCDDGLFCTVNSCDTETNTCVAVSACPPGINGCIDVNAICDEENDTCRDVPNDEACDDNSLCTEDICNAETGECENPPVECGDGIDCTDDLCDEETGECISVPNDANCEDDGLFCTGPEICHPVNDCMSAGDPCDGQSCNEENDTCEPVDGKVTICHIPPGNPNKMKTLTIGADSVPDHLGHGDTLGPC
jgi:hypothetical protein